MVAGKILAISRGLAHFIHHSNLCTTSGCHIKSIMPKISSRTLISPKESLCQEATKAGFNAAFFIAGTEMVADVKKSNGENPTQIRAHLYTHWARCLKRSDENFEGRKLAYPPVVLMFVRAMTGGLVKGQARQDSTPVPMAAFCNALGMPRL